jgi:hypothetical protein
MLGKSFQLHFTEQEDVIHQSLLNITFTPLFYFFFFKKRPSNQLETYFSKTKTKTKIKGFPLSI